MSFCPYCGKQLADGQTCDCRTKAAPTPVAPTPVAPTPVAPTPVAPTPVAPTPVAPTPVAPTPVAPTPVAPTPVAPTPVAPTPVAPAPVAPTPAAPAPAAPNQAKPSPAKNEAVEVEYSIEPVVPENAKPKKEFSKTEGVFGPIIDLVKNTFIDPIKAPEQFAETAKLPTSGIMLGIVFCCYFLYSIIHILLVYAFSFHESMGDFSVSYLDANAGFWLKHIFFPIPYFIFMTGAVIGAAVLVNVIFLKQKTDIEKILAMVAGVTLPLVACSLLALIVYAIPSKLGFFSTMFNAIKHVCGLLVVVQGLNLIGKKFESKMKMLLALLMATAILFLVDYLCGDLLLGSFASYFRSIPM